MEIEKRVHFISHYVGLLEPGEIDWLHFKLISDDIFIIPCIRKTNKGEVLFDEDLHAIKQANIIHRLALLRLADKVFPELSSDNVVHQLNKTDE